MDHQEGAGRIMAGKLPDIRDKGRCSRCPKSTRIPVDESKPKERLYLFCTKYQDFCLAVAWNCIEPSYLERKAK
jgi:hypothetical protein